MRALIGLPLRWLRRVSLALIVLAVLGLAAEFVYRSALDVQRDRVYAEFQLAASQHIDTLRKRLDAVLDLQQLLAKHVDVSGTGSAAEFSQITRPVMRVHPFISAIVFAEVDTRASGTRYPVRFALSDGAWPQPGAKLNDEGPLALAAIEQAVKHRTTYATPPLSSPDSDRADGIRLFAAAGDGITAVFLHLSDLAESTLWAGMDPDARDMAFTIVDATDDPTHAAEIYRDTVSDGFETAYAEAVPFANRRWLVIATPMPKHYELAPQPSVKRQRYAGWAITLLATLIVASLQTRNAVIRGHVQRRTAELARSNQMLAETNATLEAEIRQRIASEAALRESTTLQQAILHSADYAILLTDNTGVIRVFNPAAESMLGGRAADVVGKRTPLAFIDDGDLAQMAEESGEHGFEALLATARHREASDPLELDLCRADGRRVPASISVSPLVDATHGHITGYLLIAADITHRKAAESRILHLAHFDPLTDLPNRSLLHTRLEEALDTAATCKQPLAVLFLDLDRFKYVNDSLGHQAGDALLKAVSGRFRHCVREQDTVARMGGDEFIVVLSELEGRDHATEVAGRIIEALNAPFDIKGHRLTVTPSIGIAIYPEDGDKADLLIKHADAAMYHAKEQGRNNYQFYERRFSTSVSARLNLENRLRRALERDEFEVYYQPQVETATGEFVGLEALLRWRDPEHGLVSPDEFVPVAEDSGLIVPIGEWVLRTACRQNQAWRSARLLDVPVAVNLSARQFDEHTLLGTVAAILDETGLPPQRLELELTETLIMRNPELTAELLDAGKRLGILISVDDFGTGYSSLAYLKRFPIDRLKIDRSFIADIETEPDDAAIAQTIIAMAHTLRIDVLAEGVETVAQLRMLRNWQCSAYQGYLCSHPLPTHEMTALLRGLRAAHMLGLPEVGHA
ncbi:EAL domain-containing protein [Nitrogeniibacter mangrovi]|uniref:EAL domain-containing protein n=1 Tax=Nitrogeniibacter mangrovi TaxID=2016596 RepID=A0A6C1B5K2_9RHOO|nr:EAL domain-containing protein [Nitrogeniibacter mangrovi]QID18992.1 EAL domain-containing protein [Nitrogeniibacter mangrovi]